MLHPRHPGDKTRLSAGATTGTYDGVHMGALVENLVLDFLGTGHVAGGANGIGSAHGNHITGSSLFGQVVQSLLYCRIQGGFVGYNLDFFSP